MNNTPNNSQDQDKGWISAFLLVFGVGSGVIAGGSIIGGAVLPGLIALAVAILFFAVRRIIDQQRVTAHRLTQIEMELESRRRTEHGDTGN